MKNHNGDDTFSFQPQEGEPIGFVVPAYFSGLPSIVSEFVANVCLESVQGHYVFIVMTYGGAMVGAAAEMLCSALAKQGIHLSAAFSISTVDSYLPMFPLPEKSKTEEILKNADT